MLEWLKTWTPRWLAKRWCRRFGHPERGRFQLVVGNQCEDCRSEHTLTLECCGFCFQLLQEIERV